MEFSNGFSPFPQILYQLLQLPCHKIPPITKYVVFSSCWQSRCKSKYPAAPAFLSARAATKYKLPDIRSCSFSQPQVPLDQQKGECDTIANSSYTTLPVPHIPDSDVLFIVQTQSNDVQHDSSSQCTLSLSHSLSPLSACHGRRRQVKIDARI